MNENFRADLHSHTHCSDGTDSPEALLEKAAAVGLKGLSITDHDTIDAYTPALFASAERLQLQLLAGIELSSEWKDLSVHVLGYAFDLGSGPLREFLRQIIQRRAERNATILQKLSKKGFAISMAELEALGTRTLGRPHIAHLMVRKGYVRSTREAFDLYLKDGASCYALGIKYTPKEVIAEIHKAGGKAVLAHPHFLKKGAFLQNLLAMPFDGLECYYGTLLPFQEKPWVKIAKEKNWIATGGSDYHGEAKQHTPLGCSWVGRETFIALRGNT